MKREKQAPVSYESGTRNISAKNVQLIQSRVQGTQAQSHCDGVDRTCLTNEEHCWSLWAVWLNLRYTMLMFLNLILYPHTIPTCYTHILHSHPSLHILLYCGEGKEPEYMKWGRKYEHLYHMKQVQGISQQKRYSLSKSRVQGTQAQSHCDGVDRTQLTIEEHCQGLWAVWLSLKDTSSMPMFFYLFSMLSFLFYTHILYLHSSFHILLCDKIKSHNTSYQERIL